MCEVMVGVCKSGRSLKYEKRLAYEVVRPLLKVDCFEFWSFEVWFRELVV